jgi:hypothetical protein
MQYHPEKDGNSLDCLLSHPTKDTSQMLQKEKA